MDWDDAWRLCQNESSSLPVICNQHDQDGLTNYLHANIGSSAAWTSGRKIAFAKWTWLNGGLLTSKSKPPYNIISFLL